MACVLQIGAGGVGGVVAHKMAMNREVFSRIVLASRNIAKCAAIADSIRSKGLGEIEVDSVDADKVEEIVALIEKYKPFLVVNVALPYQDLSIMQACLQTKTPTSIQILHTLSIKSSGRMIHAINKQGFLPFWAADLIRELRMSFVPMRKSIILMRYIVLIFWIVMQGITAMPLLRILIQRLICVK